MLHGLKNIVIIGTDTDIGKTIISCAILSKTKNALGLKPISSGAALSDGQLVNADALSIMRYNSITLPYSQINPWCFKSPISPHIAATEHGVEILLPEVLSFIQNIQNTYNDKFILIEGAGGVCCPINYHATFLELLEILNWPVLLVVGLKLGCLNHAKLTMHALASSNIKVCGWVSNETTPMMAKTENLATLKSMIKAPHLGDIPYQSVINIENIANLLQI